MKQAKYRLKRACLAKWPNAWWAIRRLVRGNLEPEVELIGHLCAPSGLFLDVGANWGAYSHQALTLGLKVHSFEPQPSLAQVLRKGLGAKGAQVHELALSDRSGQTVLRVPRNDIGYSTIEEDNTLKDSADLRLGVMAQDVNTQRLDNIDLPTVSLIKIDVEGHEFAVLEGATAVIDRDKPSMIIETEDRHNRGTRARVCSFLYERGYLAFMYVGGALIELGSKDDLASRNLVFIHQVRIEELGSTLRVQMK